MSAALSYAGQLGISASNPVDKRFDYRTENLVTQEAADDFNGLRGVRSPDVTRVRLGLKHIGGTINLQPNAFEIDLLLPWILGAAVTGSGPYTYALADTLSSRYVTIDRIAKVFTYAGCKVDVATFRCVQGGPLEVEIQAVGQTETVGNAASFPSLTIDTASGPWIFSDLVCVLGGSTITMKSFELSINNMIDKERFFNSTTLTSVEALDRVVTFRTLVPYGDWATLYGASGSGGFDAVATFTNGMFILTMTIGKVVVPRMSPASPFRQEIMLPLEGKCYKDGSDREVVVTLANS